MAAKLLSSVIQYLTDQALPSALSRLCTGIEIILYSVLLGNLPHAWWRQSASI